jgi:class 3 adenylate cyclase
VASSGTRRRGQRDALPLPGRTRQLTALHEAVDALPDRGASFYLLESTPGMGKTRLLATALEPLEPHERRVVWAPSVRDQEPHRTAVQLLGATVGASTSSFEARLAVGGMTMERARAERLRLYADAAQELLAGCADRPTAVALDDFHWLDPASSEFFTVLVDELLATRSLIPLLLVIAHRPVTEGAPCAPLLQRLRASPRAVVDVLDPLDGADLFEAIEQFGLRRPSPTLQAMVQRASRGNPLRVTAALETLRRRGVPADLAPDDRRAQGTLDLRISVDDALGWWVDGLPPSAQTILGGASIVGGEFTASEAVRASGADPADVDLALDAAHAQRLLDTDGTLYWFTHGLVRDELLQRVPVSQRPRIHRRCVDLERDRAGVDPSAWARAAEHILASAGSAHTGDARDGERGESDVETLEAAARWSLGVGAWSTGARYAEAAIAAARAIRVDPAREVSLDLLAAEAHLLDVDIAATRRRLDPLVQQGAGLDEAARGKAVRLSTRAAMMASAQMGAGQVDLRPLTQFIAEATDPGERSQALQVLAECEVGQARLDEGMAHAQDAVRAALDSSDLSTLSLAYAAVGLAHLTAVDMDASEAAYRRMHDLAAKVGDGWLISESLARLPYMSLVRGDLEETDRRTAIAAEAGIRYRQYVSESLAESVRAAVAALRGDLDAVDAHSRRARSTMHRSGYLIAMQFFYPALLRARLLQDDQPGVAQVLRDWAADGGALAPPPKRYADLLAPDRAPAPDRSQSSRSPRRLTQFGIGLTAVQVESALRWNRPVDLLPLLDVLDAAVAAGVAFPMNWPVCLRRLLGDGHQRLGDPARAAEDYRAAIATCSQAKAYSELLPALLSLALLEGPAVDDDERRRAGSEAYHLASRLGFTDVASTAALAIHRSIELDAPRTDGDRRVILVTDIVGSTPLSVEVGDRAYHETVVLHHELVREALRVHAGTEFSEGGDSLLAWFADPSGALACAVDIQARLAAARRRGARCHVRIGLAAGAPLVHDGRPYGAVVNLAARIVATAAPDEVVVTEPIAASDRSGTHFRPLPSVTLRGFPGTVTPYVLALSPA